MEGTEKARNEERDLLCEIQVKIKHCILGCQQFEQAETEKELFVPKITNILGQGRLDQIV